MRDLLIQHFNEMVKDVEHLFIVQVDKDEMYNTYLDSFPAGTNEIFRERRVHDCSCCRGFIKSIGNVVSIKNNKITTIWDFETNDDTYAPVLKAMSEFIRQHKVDDVYLSIEKKIGCHHNFEILEKMSPRQWDHFYLELDNKFVIRDSLRKGDTLNRFRTARDVFKRTLDEVTLDSVNMVLDLIATDSLYKGPEWKTQLEAIRKHMIAYNALETDLEKDLYAWEMSVQLPESTSKIRNTSMGTLLVDLSEGKSLDVAVRAYEVITAPNNYKRSKPLFTQKMLDDAQKKMDEQGYTSALPRRHATLDDITINDILFSNKDAAARIQGAEDVFAELSKMTSGSSSAKKFAKIEEVSIDTFLNDVLPNVTSIEAYLENKHSGNMVSLIAPVNSDAKSMFKWGNNFTWAYAGNMTDSMKERVKALGGKVDGDLRFSIQWNEDGHDNCDLDAHCKEPSRNEIYFGNCRKPSRSAFGGQLDVDIINPEGRVAVENITWPDRNKMKDGIYSFFVHQYSGSAKKGFRAEIEFDGQIFEFDYPHTVRPNEKIPVAEVTLKNGVFSIKSNINCTTSSKEVWNLKTNEFVPVTVVCTSPNYWSTAATNVGHKHVFFMLKDCINDENPSGIFNEFLVQELYEHRHVMEAIGNKMRVADTPDQLSGLGFATDKRAELVVKVTGATERTLKIKF